MPYNIYDDKGKKIGEARSVGEDVVGGALGVVLAFVVGIVILAIFLARELALLYWQWAETIHHITPSPELNGIITIIALVGTSGLVFVLSAVLVEREKIASGEGSFGNVIAFFVVLQMMMYVVDMAALLSFNAPSVAEHLEESRGWVSIILIGSQALIATVPFTQIKRFSKVFIVTFLLVLVLKICAVVALAFTYPHGEL